MKVLVTGGHGFLGTCLKQAWPASIKVRDPHDLSALGPDGLPTVWPDCTAMHLGRSADNYDFRNEREVFHALQRYKPDVVVNAAAHVGSMAYVAANPAEVATDNMMLYLALYRAVKAYNTMPPFVLGDPPINPVRIVNVISNCSYPGDADVQREDEWWDGAVHESVAAYGNPKKMGWILSQAYRKQYGVETTNLILPNAYGPNDYVDPDRTHALNGMVLRMIEAQKGGDKQFVVWGSGKPVREWIYMPDAARVIAHVAIHGGTYPDPMNVGMGFGNTIAETAQLIKDAVGYEGELVFDTSKADGAPRKVLDVELFRGVFPTFEFTHMATGIERTVEDYRMRTAPTFSLPR